MAKKRKPVAGFFCKHFCNQIVTDFISRPKEGDFFAGSLGTKLSGGQQQRLTIARA
jgi:ABC-type transport system involved in cytochrome bd biosynthesis fused ATPase/permease subunit